jgi:hypothetical protein
MSEHEISSVRDSVPDRLVELDDLYVSDRRQGSEKVKDVSSVLLKLLSSMREDVRRRFNCEIPGRMPIPMCEDIFSWGRRFKRDLE